MILLADSGSTKTDWCFVEQGELVEKVHTKGINPFFQTTEEIVKEISNTLVPHFEDKHVDAVYFYGAGCAFPEKNQLVIDALSRFLDCPIEVGSDLLAVARSLCGHKKGIACIIGTGSNSCYYDGENIVDNVSPLGFILGDEGSGAVLGKALVGDCLKNQLPPHVCEAFFKQFDITRAEILDKVYKKSFPNRFLASLSPFLLQHIDEPSVRSLVEEHFTRFFKRNVMQYDYKSHSVHLVGSIAYYYQDILRKVASSLGIQLVQIVKSPMEGLLAYHSTTSAPKTMCKKQTINHE
ncbi:MAG: ATPase [Bacteroidaceae bacterium]